MVFVWKIMVFIGIFCVLKSISEDIDRRNSSSTGWFLIGLFMLWMSGLIGSNTGM